MNQYVTGGMIRTFRESCGLTQTQLAEKLGVSDKTVSKWETGRGYPDITMLEPLAATLGLSVIELMAGQSVTNRNRACNILKGRFYVCPICGNVLFSTGDAVVSCCGITLPPQEAEEPDGSHPVRVQRVEDEYYVSVEHDMDRGHHISFLAGLTDAGCEIRKLYPEGPADGRFKINRTRWIYYYCNRHGLFRIRAAATD